MSKWFVDTTITAGQPCYVATKYDKNGNTVFRGQASPLFATREEAQAFADKCNRKEKNMMVEVGDTIRCKDKEDLEKRIEILAEHGYLFRAFPRELLIRIIGKEDGHADEA